MDGALPHDLTIAPALSIPAQQHLSELDQFHLFLGADQRLIPTNEQTCRPIAQSKKVAESEAELDAGRAAGGVREAETALAKARKEAWGEVFKARSYVPSCPLSRVCILTQQDLQTVDPYSLSFAAYEPETGIATSVTGETATSADVFHPPKPFKSVFIHDRKTLSSYHGEEDPNQSPKEYYIMCCDCGS